MKQTNFQRKKKVKRTQRIIQEYVDHYLGTPEGEKALYDAYVDAVIHGHGVLEKTNEGHKLRAYCSQAIANELNNI